MDMAVQRRRASEIGCEPKISCMGSERYESRKIPTASSMPLAQILDSTSAERSPQLAWAPLSISIINNHPSTHKPAAFLLKHSVSIKWNNTQHRHQSHVQHCGQRDFIKCGRSFWVN